MLPFAIQFSHALKTHEHTICTLQDIVHLHKKEVDCSLYHFQIENNTFDFSLSYNFNKNKEVQLAILATEPQINSVELYSKSTRAPPSLLF